jgi:hypothetical protein
MVKRGPHLRPQASEGEAQHGLFCWTRFSVKETSVCIVDDAGKIVGEAKVVSERVPPPEGPAKAMLNNNCYDFDCCRGMII